MSWLSALPCAAVASGRSAAAGAARRRGRSRQGALPRGWLGGPCTGLPSLLDRLAAALTAGACPPAQLHVRTAADRSGGTGAATAAAQPSTRQAPGAAAPSNGHHALNGAHVASSSGVAGVQLNGVTMSAGLLAAPAAKPVLEAAGWAAIAAGGARGLPQAQPAPLQPRGPAAPNRLRIFSGTSNPVRCALAPPSAACGSPVRNYVLQTAKLCFNRHNVTLVLSKS